jgi:hypothetical protein
MTKPDLTETDSALSDSAIIIRRALLSIGGGITLIFIAGVIAGYSSVMIEHGRVDLIDVGMLGAMLAAAAAVAYGMWRFWPSSNGEPVAPRVRNARRFMLAAVVLSVPLGILIALVDDGQPSVFSNGPISPVIAAFAIGLWLIAGPVSTLMWWRNVDEHEAGAYRDGAFVALHAYMFVTPAWWMAARAGWLPAQDPMLVLLAVSGLWLIVWFIRRYL